jgi:hypothetical protein
MNPNFPLNLNIHPSNPIKYQQNSTEYDEIYSFQAQELAIRKYGIAGRVWCDSRHLLEHTPISL